jgi:hypothetical protein
MRSNEPRATKKIVHSAGVAKMIQFSEKYGFFVTMGNSNAFATYCFIARERDYQSVRVSSCQKISYIAQVSNFGALPGKA